MSCLGGLIFGHRKEDHDLAEVSACGKQAALGMVIVGAHVLLKAFPQYSAASATGMDVAKTGFSKCTTALMRNAEKVA